MSTLYLAIAVVAGAGILALGAWSAFPRRTEGGTGERLPLTPLQRRALAALLLGVAGAAGLVVLFATRGFDAYDREAGTRLAVYALLALGAGTAFAVAPRLPGGGHRAWIDERDVRILERAPAFQGVAVLVVLAAWMIGLTESYWGAPGGIPVVFPSLIFFSAVYVHLVSLSLGILIGYRRGEADA